MVNDTAIRRELMERTGWSKQSVSNRIRKLSVYMSRQYALYVLARHKGVDIESYGVDADTLVTVGRLMLEYDDSGKRVATASGGQDRKSKPKPVVQKKLVVKPTGLELPLPDFAKGLGGTADRRSMTAYSVVYVLENTIRELIRRVLQAEYKDDWWDRGVTQKIRERASELMKQDGPHSWLSGRGDDPLFYIGFSEYRKIIVGKNWKLFSSILDRKTLVEEAFTTANLVRRAVAHTAAVSKDDYDGLVVDARRVLGQIKGHEAQIPA